MRDKYNIIEDVLDLVLQNDGINKTKIMYGKFLNSKQITYYMDLILANNLIVKKGKSYSITEKGIKCLKTLREISKLMGGLNDE